VGALPLVRTEFPGVYRRGSRFVVVYRIGARQRKETVASLDEAVAIKLARDADARAERLGPTLHEYAGSGHDTMRANTRREYRRLLVNFALRYFDRELQLRDVDPVAMQQFVEWLVALLCSNAIQLTASCCPVVAVGGPTSSGSGGSSRARNSRGSLTRCL
jgi:hypothetical protein